MGEHRDGRILVLDPGDALPSLRSELLIGLLDERERFRGWPLHRPDDGLDRLELAEEGLGLRVAVFAVGERLKDRSFEVDLDDLLVLVDEAAEGIDVDVARGRGGRRLRERRSDCQDEHERRGAKLHDDLLELRTAGETLPSMTCRVVASRVAASARAV